VYQLMEAIGKGGCWVSVILGKCESGASFLCEHKSSKVSIH
jgi:hypothetical protein